MLEVWQGVLVDWSTAGFVICVGNVMVKSEQFEIMDSNADLKSSERATGSIMISISYWR